MTARARYRLSLATGMSQSDVARLHGVTRQAVSDALRYAPRPRAASYRCSLCGAAGHSMATCAARASGRLPARYAADLAAGLSVREVAARHGVTANAVHRAIRLAQENV